MWRKTKYTIGSILLIATCMGTSAYAVSGETIHPPEVSTASCDDGITTYADVIVYKTRIYNGIRQYRRWNETRGYWVDSEWIEVPH